MGRSIAIGCGVMVLFALAQGEDPLERHFFRSVQGDWHGEGTLTNREGEVTRVVEDWTAAPTDEGGFEFSGIRQWGDESQEFRWTFLYNIATDTFECEYWHTGMEDPTRLQVSLTEERMELVSHGNDSRSEIRITNRLEEEDTMQGEVSVIGSDGTEVLGGSVTHERRDP